MLDALAMVSFVIGVANYKENVSQSQLKDTAENILKGIHEHLEMQDKKLDEILERLKEAEQ